MGEDEMKLDLENFGKRVSLCMKNSGYTNKTLTEELAVSKNAVGNYINNQIPNAKILYALSQLFGVTMEYLLTGENKNNDLSQNESELLEYFARLPEREQIKFIGKIEEVAQKYEDQGKLSNTKIG